MRKFSCCGRAIAMLSMAALMFQGCSKQKSEPADPPSRSAAGTGVVGPDVLTYHNDNSRSGQNLRERILTLDNVNASTFGLLRKIPVDGKVDAQPLYVSRLPVNGAARDLLFVATENDSVYAFDANSYELVWRRSLTSVGETPSDPRECDQVVPKIGVTSTPVIDHNAGPNGAIFLVAMSKNSSGSSRKYFQRLHALDLVTGDELPGSPVTVAATFPRRDLTRSNELSFDPANYKERAALLLVNGVIYTTWASHCDIDPYTGWVIAYKESTLEQAGVLNVTPNGREGAIWMSGAGAAADAAGNIYLLDSNGTFDARLDPLGFPAKANYGNSFLRLSFDANRIAVTDYFAMSNVREESRRDEDLGSGGALLLPDMKDESGKIRHLAIGAGKDATMYVVDRDAMGKFNPARDNIYQEIRGALAPAYSAPAYFNGAVYYGTVDDKLKSFPTRNARVSQTPTSQSKNSFAYPGTTPSVSANDHSDISSSNGVLSDGIVWAVENSVSAVLHAYNAADLRKELYNSTQAANQRDRFGQSKFVPPLIANGKVYVGTFDGVAVFGLLPANQIASAR